MAFFEGSKMTAGYGDGPDIISSCIQELIMSGPSPYPAVILLPSKNAIYFLLPK